MSLSVTGEEEPGGGVGAAYSWPMGGSIMSWVGSLVWTRTKPEARTLQGPPLEVVTPASGLASRWGWGFWRAAGIREDWPRNWVGWCHWTEVSPARRGRKIARLGNPLTDCQLGPRCVTGSCRCTLERWNGP